MAEKKRIVWIDQLRSIAFYFVILGHMDIQKDLEIWIYSFHMPLFFIISGFNLNIDKLYKTDFKLYISHLAKRMLVPYFWLQLIALGMKYMYYLLIKRAEVNALNYLKGIFVANSGIVTAPSNPMYFVLLLFISQIMLWCIIKLTKGDKLLSFGIIVVMTLIPVITEGKAMPWHINVMPTAMLFIFIGRFIMDSYMSVRDKLSEIRLPHYISLCAALFVVGAVIATVNGRSSIHGNFFGKEYIVFVTGAVVTSIAFMLLVIRMPSVKIFNFIGMNTIFLLGIHEPFLLTVMGLFPKMLNHGLFVAVVSVACHFLPVPALWLVGKTMPYICGNAIKDKTIVTKIFKFVAVSLVFAAPYASFTKIFFDGALRATTPGKILAVVIFATIVVVATILLNCVSSVVFIENKAKSEAVERKTVVNEDEGVKIIIPDEEV